MSLALLFASRMLGLFLLTPVFAVVAATVVGGDNPTRVGIALGAYGLTQAVMQIPLGVSIGAVFVPRDGKDFMTLYKKADKALYEVKQHGKHSLAVFGEKNLAEKIQLLDIGRWQE